MEYQQTTGDPLRHGLIGKLNNRVSATGSLTLPAVPGLADDYTARLGQIFAGIGRSFTETELADLRAVISAQLDEVFRLSHRSTITVTYTSTMYGLVQYTVSGHPMTIGDRYNEWIAEREPPFFGVEPDARVYDLAAELPTEDCRVLDIGGGTGRNALALARRGHPVDVVELTEKFADMIRQAAVQETLDVTVISRDIFQATDDLRHDYSLIILSEVVSEFRTTEQLRFIFELAAQHLVVGGRLLFNVFLARNGYIPDDVARQYAQQVLSNFFTADELTSAAAGLPLVLEADDNVFDYEKANLPEGAWPPTSWYPTWTTGENVFGLPPESSPIDMRWLVYRKDH